jgi:hypothetical protein
LILGLFSEGYNEIMKGMYARKRFNSLLRYSYSPVMLANRKEERNATQEKMQRCNCEQSRDCYGRRQQITQPTAAASDADAQN